MTRQVIVIGAGIVGAATAYHLSRLGAAVTVIERAMPASGTTSKSFAWINANTPRTQAYHELRAAAILEYHRLEGALKRNIDLRWGGSLSWEIKGPSLVHQAEMLGRFGHPARLIDGEEFARLEPDVADPPDCCLYCPGEGAVDPVLITSALLAAAVEHGARLLSGCEVTGLVRKGDRFTGVTTNFGGFSSDMVVMAAGIWSQSLLQRSDVRLPMDNRAGLIVHTQPVRAALRHLVLTADVHVRQQADGGLVAGEIFSGDGSSHHRVEGDPAGLASLIIEKLQARLPALDIRVKQVMLGVRPVPADGFPVVGRPRAVRGLYLASMHSGITLGPLIGRLAADDIIHGGRSDLLESYGPDRFD